MDISKASNFERFVFDLVGRDPRVVAELWRRLDAAGEFDLAGTAHFARVRDFGFVSGRSSHADRLATIRDVDRRYGVVVDPHTADGIKAGLAQREAGIPLVCLETALPVKFDATIREALGTRAAAAGRVRRSRVATAAVRGDRPRRGRGQGVHRAARERLRFAGSAKASAVPG